MQTEYKNKFYVFSTNDYLDEDTTQEEEQEQQDEDWEGGGREHFLRVDVIPEQIVDFNRNSKIKHSTMTTTMTTTKTTMPKGEFDEKSSDGIECQFKGATKKIIQHQIQWIFQMPEFTSAK